MLRAGSLMDSDFDPGEVLRATIESEKNPKLSYS